MQEEAKVSLPTVPRRPTAQPKVRTRLSSLTDAQVMCKLSTGEDVLVPLAAIYELFKQELLSEARIKTGVRAK